MQKPFSQACVNNQHAILGQLARLLSQRGSVLEIGSGTGQHAVFFSQHLPHITWQTSDLEENHLGIEQWLNESDLMNCCQPITLDVAQQEWVDQQYDAIFTANTVHICSWPLVTLFFQHLKQVLQDGSLVIIYGPFKYKGQYTSQSNANFDAFLKQGDPLRGIRDIEKVTALAQKNGLILVEDNAMPANNQLLVFKYQS
jgi:cyclopropane fatty-acyl-phospholipid synthase-like methyltransferase